MNALAVAIVAVALLVVPQEPAPGGELTPEAKARIDAGIAELIEMLKKPGPPQTLAEVDRQIREVANRVTGKTAQERAAESAPMAVGRFQMIPIEGQPSILTGWPQVYILDSATGEAWYCDGPTRVRVADAAHNVAELFEAQIKFNSSSRK